MNTCADVERWLEDDAACELTSEAAAHARRCASCAPLVEAEYALRTLFAREPEDAPAHMPAAIAERLARSAHLPAPLAARSLWRDLLTSPDIVSALTGLAALVVGGGALWRAAGSVSLPAAQGSLGLWAACLVAWPLALAVAWAASVVHARPEPPAVSRVA
jgi:hypothetical protein